MENTSSTSQALSTVEENRILELARQEVRGDSRGPIIPQIKMVNDKSEVEGMQKGEYYIDRRVKDEASGEYRNEVRSIGMNPVITILVRLYSYSLYSKAQNKLLAWTNEFCGFTNEDVVFLTENKGESPRIETFLPYPEFKQYAKKNYWNSVEEKSLLKFRNVFYVWYEGEVYRMFASNASVTGVKLDGTNGDFKTPEPLSFAAFEKRLKAPEPQAYFERQVKLGSREIKDKGFYIMTFSDISETPNRSEMIRVWNALKDDLRDRFQSEYGKYLQAGHTDVMDVDVLDLPDMEA